MLEKLKEVIACLPEKEQKIINYHMGFYEGERLTLNKKAEINNLSQAYFSLRIRKNLAIIKERFPEVENFEEEITKIRLANGEKVKMSKTAKVIPTSNVEEPAKQPEEPAPKVEVENNEQSLQDEITVTAKAPVPENPQTEVKVTLPKDSETLPVREEHPGLTVTYNAEKQTEITTRLTSTLKAPSFKEIMSDLTAKEAIVVSLRYGASFNYLDKNYSTKEISTFLGIEEDEIIRICRKVLFYFKDELDLFISSLLEQNNPLSR